MENPDDDFIEGPSVSFEVKELAPAASSPRKFPWWIVAFASVLVLGAGVITWLLLPEKITVPEVVGMPYEAAVKTLNATKLKLGTKETKATGTQRPGIVIEQSPKAKEVVSGGTGVDLIVESIVEVRVPKMVGEPVSNAEEILKGLTYEEVGQRIPINFLPASCWNKSRAGTQKFLKEQRWHLPSKPNPFRFLT